ncbi:hypothetical protein [Arthrospiribacter ruber]|uniref:Uncharacterized protein n=1 Tax=Arthrospiribacter ruber TaxID=2487934 RepID=A0A951MFJ3_9BACT|nr:hypothetical protein [Arthrospiribacter ruber]MBW3470274.1 hypothetical protein [Arthrospiribacter ruber]
MRKKIDHIKACLIWIIIGSFSGLVVNKSLFTHQHILEDGRHIIHAHPFDNKQPDGHQHDESEFYYLQILFESGFLENSPFNYSLPETNFLSNTNWEKNQNFIIQSFCYPLSLRGPPIGIVSLSSLTYSIESFFHIFKDLSKV